MTRYFLLPILLLFTLPGKAQTLKSFTNEVKPYGSVDTSELLMKECSFEKDANAMVLFDKADITIDWSGAVVFVRHKRVKIFNDKGKDEANVDLQYFDKVTDVSAETVNLTQGKIEYTQVDPKLIYQRKVNKTFKNLTLAFPDVRAGSVIEIQYTWKLNSLLSIPPWLFQSNIPIGYSAISVEIHVVDRIKLETLVKQPLAVDTVFTIKNGNGTMALLALKNVRSYAIEPHMTPGYANIQRVNFRSKINWWDKIGLELRGDRDFGGQLLFPLKNEKAIIKKVDSIKSRDDKVNFIFTLVKDSMTFNNINRVYVDDPAQEAWVNRKGSSTEINMILCRLLQRAGVEAYPMLVSTPDYGVADPTAESLLEFNKCVVMIPLDSARYYVLDASNKHNVYNRIPLELLNTVGFITIYKNLSYGMVYLKDNTNLSQQLITVKANILADGKINGTVDVAGNNYNRDINLKDYQKLGKTDYIKELTGGDNNLKISDLTLDNMEVDSVPLEQHFKFNLNSPSSDESYIYFNPYMFTLESNPFISDKRYNDIDFTYNNTYTITGTYTIPQGYKVESLPQNQSLSLADKSMNIKRLFQENNGLIEVRYVISRKKQFYAKKDYEGVHNFYKKMYEMLNEQIVLKKS
ncbi:DUF3857 domain-containing protein [Mucilaginibacter sp.]